LPGRDSLRQRHSIAFALRSDYYANRALMNLLVNKTRDETDGLFCNGSTHNYYSTQHPVIIHAQSQQINPQRRTYLLEIATFRVKCFEMIEEVKENEKMGFSSLKKNGPTLWGTKSV
jgi:hypothetical protein